MKNSIHPFVFVLILSIGLLSCGDDTIVEKETCPPTCPPVDVAKKEIFTFMADGVATSGLIYLPVGYDENSDWPTIYLIDFREQHHETATDEFDQLINAMLQQGGINALVVTLNEHLDVDVMPESYEEYSELFKTMAAYVSEKYTQNTSRTFVGRGSESGVVLLTMLNEDVESRTFNKYIATDPPNSFIENVISLIENGSVPEYTQPLKLHFSYTSSNDQLVCEQLIENIEAANYPWLSFASAEYPDMVFTEAYPTAFADGLKFVFAN